MFFELDKTHFFRPLTGKYRQQVADCLSHLYSRLYRSSQADFGMTVQRDQVVEVFYEAIIRSPDTQGDDEESELRFKSPREQAVWTLNLLLEFGWMDKQVDDVSMTVSYQFTRAGRYFTEPFVQLGRGYRSRHRNTRSTYNALLAFSQEMEVYDLLDAWEHSERIISDFTEVIAELDEKRTAMAQDMEAQFLIRQVSEQFFDFMEKRFQPDLSVKLSADGVEKYRERITDLLDGIRKLERDQKASLERRLRELLPDMVIEGQSVLFAILDNIEHRISAAADIMVPQLRKAIQGFTKRADMILRQMSYLSGHQQDQMVRACSNLSVLSTEGQDAVLSALGAAMAPCHVGLLDPGQVRIPQLRQSRVASRTLADDQNFDQDSLRAQHIQGMLDQAFFVNNQSVRDYIANNLNSEHGLDTADLPVDSASDLLALAHIISAGSLIGKNGKPLFRVEPADLEISSSSYFLKRDRFRISAESDNN